MPSLDSPLLAKTCKTRPTLTYGVGGLGVQVVAGSNPVAPTIEARSNVRKIGEAAGFVSPVSVSRPTGAPWDGSESLPDGDDEGEPPGLAAGRPLPFLRSSKLAPGLPLTPLPAATSFAHAH